MFPAERAFPLGRSLPPHQFDGRSFVDSECGAADCTLGDRADLRAHVKRHRATTDLFPEATP